MSEPIEAELIDETKETRTESGFGPYRPAIDDLIDASKEATTKIGQLSGMNVDPAQEAIDKVKGLADSTDKALTAGKKLGAALQKHLGFLNPARNPPSR